MEKLRYERVASAVGTESISQFFQQKDFNKEKHFIEYRKILETINDVNFDIPTQSNFRQFQNLRLLAEDLTKKFPNLVVLAKNEVEWNLKLKIKDQLQLYLHYKYD